MKNLRTKHQQLIDLIGEKEAVQKLHGFYDRTLRTVARRETLPANPSQRFDDQVKQIIADLNDRTGLGFRTTSKITRQLIKARLNEGFTIDDFKKVHFIKCRQWLDDPKMCGYLAPTTLYRPLHFERYLNEDRLLKLKESKKIREKDFFQQPQDEESEKYHQQVMKKIEMLKKGVKFPQ